MADSDEIKDDEVNETPEETQEEAVIENTGVAVAPSPVMSPVETTVAEAQAAPTVPKAAPGEPVVLSAEAFAALMDRLGKLEESTALYEKVQDRNKIQKIEALRSQGKLVKSVKVRKIDGKFVVGWQTLQDDVYQDENGRLIEKQTVKIFFHEGSEKVYTMRQWASVGEYVPFEVTSETKDAEGNLFFKIVGPDGLALELNSTFIN